MESPSVMRPVDSEIESSNKKAAWTKTSTTNNNNGGGNVVGDAESWPALSEAAASRASPKPGSSLSLSQSMEVTPLSLHNPNPNPPASNNVAPSRHKSTKRGGGGGGGSGSSSQGSSVLGNGSLSQAPITQGVVGEAVPNQGKSSGSGGEVVKENNNAHKGDGGGQRGGGHNSYRRSNSGSQLRGDGSYHGGRKDWGNSPSRSFGSRDGHSPQQRGVNSRGFMRPAPNTPFVSSPLPHLAMRPYAPPVVYTEVPPVYYGHPDSIRPMPIYPYGYSPMYYQMPDPQLPLRILSQIDYYFSNENLVKDTFLRQNMDAEGWVSIKLIAGFKKVVQLTDNIQLILDTIQNSNVVEVQGDKVRRKGDWNKWIMTPVNYPTQSLQSLKLDDKAAS